MRTFAREYALPVIVCAIALVALAIGANVSDAYHADRCAVPIEELSWIGAGSCDRVAEWYRSVTR